MKLYSLKRTEKLVVDEILLMSGPHRISVEDMQQMAAPSPSFTASDFAGLLSSLAGPAKEPAVSWNDEELADDIATISYEKALRSHARYRPPETGSEPPLRPCADTSQAARTGEGRPATATRPGLGKTASADRVPKRASITIRLSEAECEQLRQRAAEAGLTLSAYLRSCTLEVESLRAQVKEALAQLRTAPSALPRTDAIRSSDSSRHRSWRRFLRSAFRLQRPLQ